MALAFLLQADIATSIRRTEQLLDCGIFSPENARHTLLRAAFIEVLISLRDLMYKCERYATRISFDDDVRKTESVTDVSSLIKYVRDALCHPDSENHYLEGEEKKRTFTVLYGGARTGRDGDTDFSKYEDDVCFLFGSQGIYLHRHVARAFREAKERLSPLIVDIP